MKQVKFQSHEAPVYASTLVQDLVTPHMHKYQSNIRLEPQWLLSGSLPHLTGA